MSTVINKEYDKIDVWPVTHYGDETTGFVTIQVQEGGSLVQVFIGWEEALAVADAIRAAAHRCNQGHYSPFRAEDV